MVPTILLVGGVCDHSGKIIAIVPEFDITDSFESGLDKWIPEAIDLGEPAGTWSIEGATEETSAGTHSVKLVLDNVSGAGKIWIERELEVAPAQAYDVHWVSKSYTVHARSDERGRLYVSLGVWGTWEAARSYYVDNVRLQLTRTG